MFGFCDAVRFSCWMLPLRRRAHSPALGHLWAVSLRWSRQYVLRQDSQRNGRKSSWPQYSNWQWRPIDSRSESAICVKDSDLLLAVDMLKEGVVDINRKEIPCRCRFIMQMRQKPRRIGSQEVAKIGKYVVEGAGIEWLMRRSFQWLSSSRRSELRHPIYSKPHWCILQIRARGMKQWISCETVSVASKWLIL